MKHTILNVLFVYCTWFALNRSLQWWLNSCVVVALDPVIPQHTIPSVAGANGLSVDNPGAFITTDLPPRCVTSPSSCTIRNYYITAEETVWDYAPSNEDRIRGLRLEDSESARILTVNGPGRIGHKYRKALYYGYTDSSFTKRLPRPEWQGNIGPTIRAEVGDIIRVWFWNRASHPYSIHPHGVLYQLDSEGAWYSGGGRGGYVAPGGRFLYTWEVPARAGPAQRDRGSILWGYHSHVNELSDLCAGLVGPIIIYRRGLLPGSGPEVGGVASSGPPPTSEEREFDREYVTMFIIGDENHSPYIRQNIAQFAHNRTNLPVPGEAQNATIYDLTDPKFMESNMMHAINGRVYGNLDGLVTRVGERVRWYLATFGSMMDLHTAHFHGVTMVEHGAREDTVDLLPGSFHTVDMVPDVPGKWLFHCHVDDHMMAGMAVYWRVLAANDASDVEDFDTTAKAASNITASHQVSMANPAYKTFNLVAVFVFVFGVLGLYL
ncbi:Cupredoxin [Syncephalis fuscata]|nr:Cupredoxin [Syncephalis fuscata]